MAYGINAPFGLRPINSISSGTLTSQTNIYYIPANNAGLVTGLTNFFTGDPVVWNPTLAIGGDNNGGGTIVRYGFNTNGTAATNLVSVVGVFQGCEYQTPAGDLVKAPYFLANTPILPNSKIKAYVIDDPFALYDIQVSTWTNLLADARLSIFRIGQNFGLGLGGGGNIVTNPTEGSSKTGMSAAYLAKVFTANDPAHTIITLPLKVLGYTPNLQNLNNIISYVDTSTDPYLNVRVQICNHAYKNGTLGVVAV